MNMRGKALTPILLILVILLLILTMVALIFLKKENEARVSAERKLEHTEQMLETVEARLNDSNKRILQLTENLKDSQLRIEDLTAQLNQIKINADRAIEEKNNLTAQIENLKESKEQLQDRLDNAQKELEQTKKKIKTLTEEKVALEKRIQDLQAGAGVELNKIVVSHPQVEEGRVLTVNKDYDFVIVNLGLKDGIEIGQSLYIYQGDKFLGKVKVEKLQETMSVAHIPNPQIKSAVKEGDIVKLEK
jgi:predicted RNase H-like nuclease (RuvC/YqgF family)